MVRDRGLGWWIGAGFAVGATLFTVAALAALGSSAPWVGATFFAGSIFFTAAAAGQLFGAAEVPHRGLPRAERRRLRPRAWMPAHVDWMAAAIQLAGTILFNFDTFHALDAQLDTHEANRHVWAPDAAGSICFLAASLLAFANIEHSWLSWRPRDRDWQIAAVNLAGSAAFGISALASFERPETGEMVAEALNYSMTALGGFCFLVGAVLLSRGSAR